MWKEMVRWFCWYVYEQDSTHTQRLLALIVCCLVLILTHILVDRSGKYFDYQEAGLYHQSDINDLRWGVMLILVGNGYMENHIWFIILLFSHTSVSVLELKWIFVSFNLIEKKTHFFFAVGLLPAAELQKIRSKRLSLTLTAMVWVSVPPY